MTFGLKITLSDYKEMAQPSDKSRAISLII